MRLVISAALSVTLFMPSAVVWAATGGPQPALMDIPTSLGDVTEVELEPDGTLNGKKVSFELDLKFNEAFGIAVDSRYPVQLEYWFLYKAGPMFGGSSVKWRGHWYQYNKYTFKQKNFISKIYVTRPGQYISPIRDRDGMVRVEIASTGNAQRETIKVLFSRRHWLESEKFLGDPKDVGLTPDEARQRMARPTRKITPDYRVEDWVPSAFLPTEFRAIPKFDLTGLSNFDPAIQPYVAALLSEGRRNAVVNLNKLGLVAMEKGNLKLAEWAFDRAIEVIDAIAATGTGAEKAATRVGMEAMKDFKGEPYERSMTYYYRGLLHLAAGEFENARVSFRAAELFDTMAAEEPMQSDFALLQFMNGWASKCMGDAAAAKEAFGYAQAADPTFAPPAANDNTIALLDIGLGPVKMMRGRALQILTINRSVDAERSYVPAFMLNGRATSKPRVADIHFQAITRGGRPIDHILGNEIRLRDTAELVGIAGWALPPLLLVPVVFRSTRPEADSRMWETIPDRVGVSTLRGTAKTKASFAVSGIGAANQSITPMLNVQRPKCSLVWGRTRSALETGPGVYGDHKQAVKKREKMQAVQDSDAAFTEAIKRELNSF